MRPIWVPWKFSGLPHYAYGYFSQNFMGFCSDGRPTVRKSVGELLQVLHTYYSSISTRLLKTLDCSFEWGLRTPNLGEGEAVWGREWYRSKERWWLPIGRNFSSIFTRFRDTCIAAFVLQHATFPLPMHAWTSSLPQMSPCSAESRWIAFWLQRAKVLG